MEGLDADIIFRPRRALARTPPGRAGTLPTAANDVVTEREGQAKLEEHSDSVSLVNHEAEVVEDSAGDGPCALPQGCESGLKETPTENRSTCIPSSGSGSATDLFPPACEAIGFVPQAPATPPAHHHPELGGTPNPFAPSRALARTPPPSPHPSSTSPAAPDVQSTDLVQAMDICTSTLAAEVGHTCSAATAPGDAKNEEEGGGGGISPARAPTATSTGERGSAAASVLAPEAGGERTVGVPSRHTAARRKMVDTATSTDELRVAEAARHQVEVAALRVRLSRSTEEAKRLVASWMDAQDQLQHVQKERDDTVVHVSRLRDELVAIKARGETQGVAQVEQVMQARLCELEAKCALSELELALDCLNEQDRLRQVELLHAEASYHSLREQYREDHHSICNLARGLSQRVVSLSGCVETSVERLQHLVNLQRTSMEHRLKAAKAEHASAEAKMKVAMQHAHARAQQDMVEQMKMLKGDKALLATRLADAEKRAEQEIKRVQERSEEVQRLEAELAGLRSKAVVRSEDLFPSAGLTSTDFMEDGCQALPDCSPGPSFPPDDHSTELETVLVAMEVDKPAAGNPNIIAVPVPARDNVKGRRGRKERPTTQQESPSSQPPKAKRGRPAKLQARAELPPPPQPPQQADPTSPAVVKVLDVPKEHEPPKAKAKKDRPAKLQARPEPPPPPPPQQADDTSATKVKVLDLPMEHDPAVPSRTEAPKPLVARSRSCLNVTAKTSDARFKIQKMGIFKAFRGGAIPKLRAEVAHKAQGAMTHGV